MKKKGKIAILGAGPAGLALAMNLLRRDDLNCEIVIYEKNDDVGGLAGSFEYSGLYFDFGSHRLHRATAPYILQDIQNLLQADLFDRPRNGRIRLLGEFVKFPLHPFDFIRHLPPSFALGFTGDLITKPIRKKHLPQQTFADVLLDGLGKTICHSFYFPYARKLWGLEVEEIAATQAERRVSANNMTKIIKKLLGILPGFKKEGTGRFYYPRRGYGQISQYLSNEVQRLGGKLLLSSNVHEIYPGEGHSVKLVLNKEDIVKTGVAKKNLNKQQNIEVDFVFSTIPIPVLARLIRPKAAKKVQAAYSNLKYRSMILHYLVLQTDRFSQYDAHYFPEAEIMMSRLSEPKNYSDAIEPRGITGLCSEIPCNFMDDVWNMSDETLTSKVISTLNRIGLSVNVPVRSAFVKRLSHAYPVYDLGFEDKFNIVDSYIESFANIVPLGRQGLFAHDNTHHTMEMAYKASECLNADLRWDEDRWRKHRLEFVEHVVED